MQQLWVRVVTEDDMEETRALVCLVHPVSLALTMVPGTQNRTNELFKSNQSINH